MRLKIVLADVFSGITHMSPPSHLGVGDWVPANQC
jgi:hypothetical protein